MDTEKEYTSDRANRSTIWEHFEIKDCKERTAECKACRDTFSFKSSISNLRKHFKRKHAEFISGISDRHIKKSNSDVEEETQGEHLDVTYLEYPLDNENEDEVGKLKSGQVWKYFEALDDSSSEARCRLCSEVFSYRSTTGILNQHIRTRHSVGVKDLDDDGAVPIKTSARKRSKSAAWTYFTVHDEKARIARCKICGILNSYMTSISNLLKHVRRKHADVEYDSNQLDDSSDENSESADTHSLTHSDKSLFRYFKKIDNTAGLAECLLCKQILCFMSSLSGLYKHLAKEHPHVKLRDSSAEKTMFISEDGQWYEMVEEDKHDGADDNDPISGITTEPMEIYLDEENGLIEDKGKETKLKKAVKKRNRPDTSVVLKNSSSDDEPTERRRSRNEDSLDVFGRYLVSLLRDLPQEESMQLQGEFIKQVIDRKMSLKNESPSTLVTVSTQEEVVVVPNASDDHIYVLNMENEK